jgi:ABC-type Fe3+-siderophore transport system permease subunit
LQPSPSRLPGTVRPTTGSDGPASRRLRLGVVFATGLVLAAVLAVVHLSQGTAGVDGSDLFAFLTGSGDDQAGAVLVSSRLPRLLAGLLVGVALGVAGAVMQTVARNVLASPDTLAVNAGAYLAIVAAAAFGVTLPLLAQGLIAFAGGLAAAALVLGLSAGSGSGTVRLVLAGSAIALALSALTTVLILLFTEETTGMYAWSAGSLAQTSLDGVSRFGPVVAAGVACLLLLAPKLDVLSLGEDAASVLGLRVRSTQLVGVLLAVLLSAASVTVAGPIGFVGLAAPALVRLLATRVPGLQRHRMLLPASALMGVVVVLGADVLLRAAFGGQAGVDVPTGVVTTLFGAVFLVVLARRMSDTRALDPHGVTTSARTRRMILVTLAVALTLVAVLSLMLGDTKLLGGDLLNWLTGQSGPVVSFVMDTRLPRVMAAVLAGAALALSGTIVQAVARNPLAEPGILGVTGGAGLGAVLVITLAPVASFWLVTAGGLTGAALASAFVFGLAASGGLNSQRLILIGIGVSAAAAALVSMVIISTDPYNGAKALTWLSGSTYGRTLPQLVPLAVALAVSIPVLGVVHRDIDILAQCDDTPRLLGIRVDRTRLLLLSISVLLAAAAVAAVGVIGFVGLVAPHAARALVGGRSRLVLPTAALLGALLVSVADTLGRTVIAPAQLPAGLLTALVGAPYFVWLLWRSRRTS